MNTAHKVLIPTGYMGSGSSAITDMLSSFEQCEAPNGSFEYVFLHCPGGLFDLEDKLLQNNNALRSDEALRTFLATMQDLFDKSFSWIGGYESKISPRFMEMTQEFVDALVQFRPNSYWYYQEKKGWAAFPHMVLNKLSKAFLRGRPAVNAPLKYRGMMLSLPDSETFHSLAREYLAALFVEMGVREHSLILDQLLLPFNLFRMDVFFGENVECFVVDRDPRDVFLLNKYIWGPRDHSPVPFPIDVDEFCSYYRTLRASEKPCASPHAHRIHFEDCIFKYDEVIAQLSAIIGGALSKEPRFNPSQSIENTQLFLLPEYSAEGKVIEEKLSEWLYQFPEERMPRLQLAF